MTPTECLVSRNIKLPWLWPRASVQTWVDPITSSSSIPPVLQLNITFWSGTTNQYHVVQVTTNQTVVRTGNATNTTYEQLHQRELSVGWLNVSLDISHNLTLTKWEPGGGEGEEEVLISYPMQHSVMNVAFSGSNVTVNCSSG